jgi:hypothetical protein
LVGGATTSLLFGRDECAHGVKTTRDDAFADSLLYLGAYARKTNGASLFAHD